MQNIYEEIQTNIKKKFHKNVEMDTVLSEIGIDSLDLLDFIVEMEEKYNIKFEDNELLNIRSVRDVVNLILGN